MNIKQQKIEKKNPEEIPKITKLAIGKPGGGDFTGEEWEQIIEIKCLKCNEKLDYKNNQALNDLVTSVLNTSSENEKENIKAWEEEISPCEHTLTLKQDENIKIAEKSIAKCNDCELNTNLWLCLTCGNLACGRKETGGHQHAIEHYNKTKHPLVVKTGTITPDGNASLYCYKCDDDVKDEFLAKHLKNFGIDISTQKKTDKTVSEMNLDFNINFTLSKTIEEGKVLTPLYGEGFTGLENIGNSCYMNSVIQILFSLEPFKKRYFDNALEHLNNCNKNSAECFLCQMSKIFYGLYSGIYSQKKTRNLPPTEDNKKGEIEEYQDGIKPSSFKLFFGKGHPDFSSNKQQDAFEYLTYLLEKIQKEDKKNFDPIKLFQFDMETRMECTECHNVKYRNSKNIYLNFLVDDWKNKKDENTKCSMDEVISKFLAIENIEIDCPICKKKTNWEKTQRVKNFPKYLIIVFQRFVFDWVPVKLEVAFEPILDNFDLSLLSKNHKKENEKIIETTDEKLNEETEEKEPEFSQENINFLLQCGIPELGAKWGLFLNNNDPEIAMAWYCENTDNPEYKKPLPKIKVKKSDKKNDELEGVNMSSLENMIAMGFDKKKSIIALKKTNNNIDAALELIYTNPNLEDENQNDKMDLVEDEKDNGPLNEGNGNFYDMYAYLTHLGKNTDHGHYVCHIRQKDNKWTYFNDSRVTLWEDPPIKKGYIYFYRNKDNK